MSTPSKSLDVGVKVTSTGADEAVQGMERIGEAASKAAQQVEKLSKRQVQDNLDALRQQRSDAANEEVRQIDLRTVGGLKETTEAAKGTSRALGEVKQLSENAGRAVRGLADASQGGIKGLAGMANAARGLTGILRSLKGLLLTPLGAVFMLAAGAIAYMGKVASDNKKKMEELHTGAKDRAEKYREKVAQVKEEMAAWFTEEEKRVKALVAAYNELFDQMDKAEARRKKVVEAERAAADAKLDREEQEAFERAPTKTEEARQRGQPIPTGEDAEGDSEARTKIRTQFALRRKAIADKRAVTDIENEVMTAELRVRNARSRMAEAGDKNQEMIDAVAAAEQKASDAVLQAAQVAEAAGYESAAAAEAVAAARLAKEALAIRKAQQEKVAQELSVIAASLADEQDKLNLARELAPLQLDTLNNQNTTRDAKELQDEKEQLKLLQQREAELGGRINIAGARRFTTGEATDTSAIEKELTAAQKEMRRLQLAIQAHAKETTTTVSATSKAVNKWTVQVRNNRP